MAFVSSTKTQVPCKVQIEPRLQLHAQAQLPHLELHAKAFIPHLELHARGNKTTSLVTCGPKRRFQNGPKSCSHQGGSPPPSRPWGRATPEYSLLGWTNSHAELFCSFPNSWCSALRKLQQECPCVRQAIVVRGSPFSNVLEGCEIWPKCRVTCNWRSCNSRCGFVSAQLLALMPLMPTNV